MMIIGIVFLVFFAVLIPLTAIVGALYVGWLAEKGPRPHEAGLPEEARETPPMRPVPVAVRPQP
jgi:hypothetical protein